MGETGEKAEVISSPSFFLPGEKVGGVRRSFLNPYSFSQGSLLSYSKALCSVLGLSLDLQSHLHHSPPPPYTNTSHRPAPCLWRGTTVFILEAFSYLREYRRNIFATKHLNLSNICILKELKYISHGVKCMTLVLQP